jgi:hypothetical protein
MLKSEGIEVQSAENVSADMELPALDRGQARVRTQLSHHIRIAAMRAPARKFLASLS